MPVVDAHAFVFDGPSGPRVRSLKAFVGALNTVPRHRLEEHLRRHDFSRWIDDVFRDRSLATRLRALEARQDGDSEGHHVIDAISQAIRARYETAADAADRDARRANEPSIQEAAPADS